LACKGRSLNANNAKEALVHDLVEPGDMVVDEKRIHGCRSLSLNINHTQRIISETVRTLMSNSLSREKSALLYMPAKSQSLVKGSSFHMLWQHRMPDKVQKPAIHTPLPKSQI
jgi:hypothetical protein